MSIPFLDLRAAYLELREEIDAAVARALMSGKYIGGAEVAEFEAAFAAFCEADFCVGVGSGLEALHLALRAIGVGQGDEVIVSTNTFIATWLAVSMVGATPIPVEPDPATHNLDPLRVEAAITGKTKVLLPTHLYGQPADLDPLLDIARRYGLRLVEDAAQAHGARYKGRRIGAHGDAVAWSFYPGKNLGAVGDAGAVTTNDAGLAERIRMLGNYGSSRKYVNDIRGFNSRLDPIQACILSVKLRHLDDWNGRRARMAGVYRDCLGSTGLVLPSVPSWAQPSWHLFVVETENRNVLQQRLQDVGVQTLVHYPNPPHLQQAYADSAVSANHFPIAERLAQRILSLPIGPHLKPQDVETVVRELIHNSR